MHCSNKMAKNISFSLIGLKNLYNCKNICFIGLTEVLDSLVVEKEATVSHTHALDHLYSGAK